MNTGRPRGLAAMLTLALGAGTVAGAGLLGSPAFAEDTLTGTYTLKAAGLFAGQSTTLTQASLVDPTPESEVARTVDWGDGNTEKLDADSATHQYTASGTFPVTVTLTDTEPDSVPVTIAVKSVQVAAVTSTFKFSAASAWTWEYQGETGGATGKLSLASIPATATRVWVAWGDGETSLVSRTATSASHYYETIGTYAAKVTLESAAGKIAAKSAGSFLVRVDSWQPSASLKVPSSPSKAASWKTVQGTAKDNQSGIDVVDVQLFRWTSSKDYYYNFVTKKWIKYTWTDEFRPPAAAVASRPVDSKGVWKVSVAGQAKGYTLQVMYTPYDLMGKHPEEPKYRLQKLTS